MTVRLYEFRSLGGCHLNLTLDLFSRYEFLQRVGEGAYGSVWRCQDKVTGEIVACKKLKDVAQSEEVRDVRQHNLLTAQASYDIVFISQRMDLDLPSACH